MNVNELKIKIEEMENAIGTPRYIELGGYHKLMEYKKEYRFQMYGHDSEELDDEWYEENELE